MNARESAYNDWQKGLKYKEISEKYGVSLSAVKSWATRDWKHRKVATKSNKKLQPKSDELQPRGGAPYGNQNATGHGAPLGNKNSEKHGIYSSVFWDVLDEQETQLIGNMPTDEEQHLLDEIRLLTVRERRLMQKIQELGNSPRGMIINEVFRSETKRTFDGSDEEKELDKAIYDERQRDKIDRNELLPGRAVKISTSSINNSDLLLRAHAELTRVQSQKTRCIEALSKIRQSKENAMGNSMANDWIIALTGGDDEYGQD